MKKNLYPLLLSILISSCASSFKSVNPSTLNINTRSDNSDVEFFYKYDVLREKGNKKYSKKELKAGIRLVAIKVTNTTGRTIKFGDNARLYSGDSEIRLWPPDLIHKKIKQTTPLYLLYLLLTPMEFTTSSNGYETNSIPVGYVIGPGLAAGNIAVAATANARLKNELMQFDMLDREIKSGETVYGLVGIPESGFVPLRIVLKP